MKYIHLTSILVISILLSIARTSFGQTNKAPDKFDLEGTWVYTNDSIEFQTNLSKVTIQTPTKDSELILGFSKLIINNKVIYDNISSSTSIEDNKNLTFEDFGKLLRKIENPEITVNSESMEGHYFAPSYSKKIQLKLSMEENMLVLHFISVSNNNEFPNLLGKGVKIPKPEFYNIPEVPSTWILKRVKE